MSVDETMKDHMDAVRGVTGVSKPLSMAMATNALNDIDLFRFKAVGGTFPMDGEAGNIPIEAPVIEGYTFAFWLNAASIGSVADSYVDTPNESKANIWARAAKGSYFQAVAVYVKSAFMKLGGVINPVLSVFKRVVAPLMGGVAYVA